MEDSDHSPRSKRWWNDEISEQRTEMARERRKWKDEKNEVNHGIFKAKRNKDFRTIVQRKRKSWDELLEKAGGKDIFTALNYTKPRKTRKSAPIESRGKLATNFKEKAEIFRKTMFPEPPSDPVQPIPGKQSSKHSKHNIE